MSPKHVRHVRHTVEVVAIAVEVILFVGIIIGCAKTENGGINDHSGLPKI
jgi:hypothetical protein